VLQTLGSDEKFRTSEPALGTDDLQGLNLNYYLDILKGRFLYFLGVFGLVSILGLYLAAIQKPLYLSEGKILVQSQEIAPDIVTPVITATAGERAQLIQQRVMTRDHLLSIASRYGLFPRASDSSDVVGLMRKRIQIKPVPVDMDGQLRPNSPAVAFTIGFEYEDPALAMRVANEFITLIVDGDERSRTTRTTEMVKVLTTQAKDIEDKLESTQSRILEVAQRPDDTEISERQKSQFAELAALKAELSQKASIYSNAHPVIIALKKSIAALERRLAQSSRRPAEAQPTADDDMNALKRQRQALEKRLAEANAKLASARLSEKLNQLQQSGSMQVIEAPSFPQKPMASKKVKILIVGMAFAAAAMLGLGAAIGPELLKGAIRSRDQLTGVVDSSLIVCIPYIATRADNIRRKLKALFGVIGVVVVLAAWGGLGAAIVLHLPVDFSWFNKAGIGIRTDR
jgi:protein tyrosine kinase modulator